MKLEDYFDFLSSDDIRIKGTRVGIETVLYDFIHRNYAPEEIAGFYPSITLEQIYATITYYLHEREMITKYLENWLEHGRKMREYQRQKPSLEFQKLREIRAKYNIEQSEPALSTQ